MPTYEYRCRNCGHTFDVVQAMSDETLTVCPICGGERQYMLIAFLREQNRPICQSNCRPSSSRSSTSSLAKALGLDVPWFLQQRADEVIE